MSTAAFCLIESSAGIIGLLESRVLIEDGDRKARVANLRSVLILELVVLFTQLHKAGSDRFLVIVTTFKIAAKKPVNSARNKGSSASKSQECKVKGFAL